MQPETENVTEKIGHYREKKHYYYANGLIGS